MSTSPQVAIDPPAVTMTAYPTAVATVSAPPPMIVQSPMQYVAHQFQPTDQPYQQEITNLEFHAGGGGMAYAANRRLPQQLYVPPNQRPM